MTSTTRPVFVRDATGLVREISAYRAFVLNLLWTSPAFMLIFMVVGQGLFPGGNLPLACVIGLIISLPVGILYALFSAALPRSGGDYVFVGRIIHPVLGFMVNFVITVIAISVIGTEAVWITTMGLGPMFNALSAINADPSLATLAATLTTTTSQFIIGGVFAVLLPLVLFFGTNVAFRVKSILFVITTFSILTFIVVMALTPQSVFISNWNSVSPISYSQVLSAGSAAGVNTNFDLGGTFLAVVYTALAVEGFNASAYVAGEVKRPATSQMIGMLLAPAVYLILMTLVALAAYSSMGQSFIASIAYLALNGNSAYNLPVGLPILQFLAGYGTKNAIVECILGIGLLATLFAYMISATFTSVRCLFAWSFDRIFPTKFAAVDDKFHVPYISLIAIIIVNLIFVYLTVYTTLSAFFTYVVTGAFSVFAIVGLAAILLPYRRKDIFNASPSIVTRKIGGLPVIVLVGAVNVVIGILVAYASLLPALVGPLNPAYIGFVAGLFLLGFVIYYVAYAIQKTRGISLALLHKEIPPE